LLAAASAAARTLLVGLGFLRDFWVATGSMVSLLGAFS